MTEKDSSIHGLSLDQLSTQRSPAQLQASIDQIRFNVQHRGAPMKLKHEVAVLSEIAQIGELIKYAGVVHGPDKEQMIVAGLNKKLESALRDQPNPRSTPDERQARMNTVNKQIESARLKAAAGESPRQVSRGEAKAIRKLKAAKERSENLATIAEARARARTQTQNLGKGRHQEDGGRSDERDPYASYPDYFYISEVQLPGSGGEVVLFEIRAQKTGGTTKFKAIPVIEESESHPVARRLFDTPNQAHDLATAAAHEIKTRLDREEALSRGADKPQDGFDMEAIGQLPYGTPVAKVTVHGGIGAIGVFVIKKAGVGHTEFRVVGTHSTSEQAGVTYVRYNTPQEALDQAMEATRRTQAINRWRGEPIAEILSPRNMRRHGSDDPSMRRTSLD